MTKVYFDMDGVLADFDGQENALKRFAVEPGFFQLLKPTSLVDAVNELLKNETARENIYILSASPNTRADIDKVLWLFQHLPNLKSENIIIVRGGAGTKGAEEKMKYADPKAVLIDDYTGNLLFWQQAGGIAIKLINGRNGKGEKWTGKKLFLDTLLTK